MKFSLVLSLLLLFGCSTVSEKPEVVNTSSIRISKSQCSPTSISKIKLKKLGETAIASALMRVSPTDTVIVTFFTSPEGSWTVLIDSMTGISCMVMWGEYWQMAGRES